MNHDPVDPNASPLGQPIERREDVRFLTGKGLYTDDIQLDGMVHAVVLRSPMAHARILSVDTDEARRMPGVVDVIAFADIADTAQPIPVRLAQLPGRFKEYSQMPLAGDKVRYVGEPIAVVVASSAYEAEDAAELIAVEFEELPAVVTFADARRDETLLHEDLGSNISTNYTVGRGDIDAAFRDAAYTRKERFRTGRHSGVPLETRSLIADWNPDTERMRIWGVNKVPFAVRDMVARMLRMEPEHIDMLASDVGGGFGVRGEFYPEDFLIPFLARRLGRPVKWIEDRREHLMATAHGREMECEIEIAVDADQMITGLRASVTVNLGAYVRPNAGVAPAKCGQALPGPFRIPHYQCEITTVQTNKTPAASYRGPGRYESAFFRERIIDLAAADLGLDPAEFRLKNLITAAEQPYDIGSLVPYLGPDSYDTGDYRSTLNCVLEKIDYDRIKALRGRKIDGRYHGIGMCCFVASAGGGPGEHVLIEVEGPGKVHLYIGSSGAGQGYETSMAQILAHELGIGFDDIVVHHGGTAKLPYGYGSWHSRSTVMAGNAITNAARTLIDQMIELTADRAGLGSQALEYRAGAVYPRGKDTPLATLDSLAEQIGADEVRTVLAAPGLYETNELTYTYGAQVAHVAVDADTGKVEVIRFVTSEDVGRVINPLTTHGQSIGGTVQGMGPAFLDEFVYDSSGQLLTGSFADYLVPVATDFPVVESITLTEYPSARNPLGVKGAAEGGIGAPGGCLGNAVGDALRPLGIVVRELPMTPSRIAALLEEAGC
ncbi:MAG: xanthine dehydrogenase family protein molybdopterin-binding subunit [Microbacterium sp.]